MTTRTLTHTCRSCRAPILWAISEKHGRRMPLDRVPVVGGNVRIVAPGPPPVARVLDKDAMGTVDLFDDTDDGVRYLPHHATCPDGADW